MGKIPFQKTCAFCLLLLLYAMLPASAESTEHIGEGRTLLYIPLDNRPINAKQSIEVVEKLGYNVAVPPAELLGSREDHGHPDKLWEWLRENAPRARAAVLSSDALIYGSLVGSRTHNLDEAAILERAERFAKLHTDFPRLPLYVFGTVMRTPRAQGSSEEPDYYREYGERIFCYTALKDKAETEDLSRREKQDLLRLEQEIPAEHLADWMTRREKNFEVNRHMIDLTRHNTFSYCLLGCDDSSRYSQTHLERRHLAAHGSDLGATRFLVTSGADELGLMMLCRAVQDDRMDIPFLFVQYNVGKGPKTVSPYVNEEIGHAVDDAIHAIGGLQVREPSHADFVMLVNTSPDGKTRENSDPTNIPRPHDGTTAFLKMVKDALQKGYPVGIADIYYNNGGDNALMEQLRREDLQFRIRAYGGWNTATNTTGFLLGTGALAHWMNRDAVQALLLRRYFDDWIYQSNVRAALANRLYEIPGEGGYGGLDQKYAGTVALGTSLLYDFAQKNLRLPPHQSIASISISFPWNRMFESDITATLAGTSSK